MLFHFGQYDHTTSKTKGTWDCIHEQENYILPGGF